MLTCDTRKCAPYDINLMDVLLHGLNEAQKSAVTSPAPVLQVLAPPGSGKTKTLTARVAYLIGHEGYKPWNMVVCTFTKKAAREMKERIRSMLGEEIGVKLILGTFHHIAHRFLVRYGQEIGIPKNFGIADTSDSTAIIKRIITRNKYNVDPSQARSRISGLKAKGITADQFSSTSKKQVEQQEFACVYIEYEDTLAASNLLDFDDLLLRCVELLRNHPACVSNIEAVLIDEYQDTNNVQYELMTLLAQRRKHITIVGDPDQSIYSFRSAEIKNLYRMQSDYRDTVVINLENNYRSSGCILSSAMAVIEQDETRPSKALQATHCVGEQPTLRHLCNAHIEAQWLVDEVNRSRTLSAGLLDFNDYAILLRSSTLSLSIERALGKAGIPYRMVGGRRFFDRAEIKIVLDYLRVINQPEHNDALVRIVNVPSRKIGDVTVKALLEEAESRKLSLWKLILDCAQGKRPQTKISTQAQKGIDSFVNLILTSRHKLLPEEGQECYLLDLISHILQKISFEAYLKQMHKENWRERWANVEELVAQATQMASTTANGEEVPDEDALPVVDGIEQRRDTAADVLSKFLVNVALSTEIERPDGEEPNQVTISTVHAAKGLEWPVVFIPAVYDGSIPHSRAEDHDEERRLLQSAQEETILSKFVSSRSLQKYFSAQGPSISCSVIQDLAQILRRPCPMVSKVETARNELERIEDDQYPLTREEIDGEDTSWSTSNPSRDGPLPSTKRRRIEKTTTAAGFTASTTMQKSASFSVSARLPSGNGGFTSASTYHLALKEARAVGEPIAAPNPKTGRAAYNEAKRTEPNDKKPVRNKAIKPRATGQGAITSFFGRPTSISEEPVPSIVSMSALPRSQSASSGHGPLTDISNVLPQPSHPYRAPSLSTHRPRTVPMSLKPKRPETESGVESLKHALMSSSPVKPDYELPGETLDLSENEGLPPSPTMPSVHAVKSTHSGFRPATSFHSTSTTQLQNRSGPPRKTLGMRRSMQGWNVKHQQPPRPA
ncbi:UvrD-helicase-domain-containing protein [Lophiostoma macrostomum CBS 122681]|uniref:DNA 3'-5' helicase n=1 Tax=Lophiostoma macrostomum CBS 122681 TaxID=1314788 RepID=A0A6A6T1D8_9PLEO|nr:UvrD-helicase-domain-containing protein [Lophiostoma macrostomum CBS 122681]